MSGDESEFVRLERLEKAGGDDHQKATALGADGGRIELGAGINKALDRRFDLERAATAVERLVDIGRHLGGEANRGAKELAPGARLAPVLLELFDRPLHIRLFQEALGQVTIAIGLQIFAGHSSRSYHPKESCPTKG